MTDADLVLSAVRRFFHAFRSGPGLDTRLAELRALFVDGAIVVRVTGDEVTVSDVDSFIEPRRALLDSGQLTEFREWPADGQCKVSGEIAHWFGGYEKSGELGGQAFAGLGLKSIQFVRQAGTWRICAVAWADEVEGLTLADLHQRRSRLSVST